MKNFVQRIYLRIRAQRFLFWIPLLVLNGVLIGLSWLSLQNLEMPRMAEQFHIHVKQLIFTMVPFFSVWWPLLILKDRCEGEGREVLLLHSGALDLLDAYIFFLIYLLNLVGLNALLGRVLTDKVLLYEFLRILFICVFFFGIAVFVIKLIRHFVLATLCLLVYSLLNTMLTFNGQAGFPFYFNLMPFTDFGLLIAQLPFLFVGLILLIASTMLPERL